MTQNQIERLKERINFLSRTMLACVAGVYLLAGAIGGYMIDWLARDEFAWSAFGIVPTIAVVAFIVLSFEAFRLRRKINHHIDQLGEVPCSTP